MDAVVRKLIAQINKDHGPGTLTLGSEIKNDVIPRTPSGSLSLDLALGGGWPANQWSEIVGNECLAPGTKVLCADLVWRNVEDLYVGQEIIGFDEEPGGRGKGRASSYRRATVTDLGVDTLPVYEITTPLGKTYASEGHLWLVHVSGCRRWVRSDSLLVGHRIASLGPPWQTDTAWEGGWLAGFYDGEGHVEGATGRVKCNQAVGATADFALMMLDKLGFDHDVRPVKRQRPHWQDQLRWTLRGRYQDMRFLGTVRPQRLMERSSLAWEGKSTKSVHGSTVPVLSVKPVGRREVITIGTSTKTLVADGLLSHNSHGKTAVALKTVAENQKRNPDWFCLWIAAEDFVTGYAEMLGVDLSRVLVLNTNIMEVACQKTIDFATERAVDCIVWDSLPALIPQGEFDAAMEELQVGLGARVMNKFFRKQGTASKRSLVDEDRPITGLIINQWRDKIGIIYGDPRTTPGGRMKNFTFFARVEVRRGEWIKEGDRNCGIEINARVFKNKSAAPEKRATVDFYFDDMGPFRAGEFDRVKEIVNLAIFYEVIERPAQGIYTYGGDKWRGRPALIEQFREDLDLQEAVEAEVISIAAKKTPAIAASVAASSSPSTARRVSVRKGSASKRVVQRRKPK